MSDDSLMTVEDVARRIAMSDSFVYAAIAAGRLRHHRLGRGQGGIRVSPAHLAAFLADTERVAGPAPAPPTPPPARRYRHLT